MSMRQPGGPGMRGYLSPEEKASIPPLTPGLSKRILSYLKPYWPQFLAVLITILASAVIGLLPSIITGRIVDEALIGRNMRLLLQLLLGAFVTLTLSQVLTVAESYISSWISQRIIYDMKNQMYDHLLHMPHAFFTTEKQGDIITRMNSDISGVSSVISGTLSSIVSNAAIVVTTLAALFAMSWQLAIVGVIVIPLLIIPTRQVGKQRFTLLSAGQSKYDALNEQISETLSVSGSLLVKLFGREKLESQAFRSINQQVTRISLKEQRSGQWFHMIMGMFTQLAPLMIYFAGGWFIIRRADSALTVGAITATVALINRLYRPVQQLLNLQVDFTRSLALFSRIFEYLDRINTIPQPEFPKKPSFAFASVSFHHVRFRYEKNIPLLEDVSFFVPGGKTYAIVGPSGSGKSTIANLIPRLYDAQAGHVRVAGIDVKEMDLEWLRGNIGMVTQEAYLFNGTILENLRCAKPSASMEELERACRISSIYDFVLSQPQGFDTVVGNRGLKLSGGEKQRLSLARVILKDPRILILDEATSALDSISEQAIQSALEKLMRDRTSIVIAHRLSTILAADRILVVSKGAIVQEGTHPRLLEEGGLYRQLYDTQFSRVLERSAETEES